MKLKEGFILHQGKNENYAVATGEASRSFNGLIRLNSTAAFLVEQLQSDRSLKELTDALVDEYDVSADLASQEIASALEQLKSAGVLEGGE